MEHVSVTAVEHHVGPWAVDSVLALSEDTHHRIELLGGALLLSPRTGVRHQRASLHLAVLLSLAIDHAEAPFEALETVNVIVPDGPLIPDLVIVEAATTAEAGTDPDHVGREAQREGQSDTSRTVLSLLTVTDPAPETGRDSQPGAAALRQLRVELRQALTRCGRAAFGQPEHVVAEVLPKAVVQVGEVRPCPCSDVPELLAFGGRPLAPPHPQGPLPRSAALTPPIPDQLRGPAPVAVPSVRPEGVALTGAGQLVDTGNFDRRTVDELGAVLVLVCDMLRRAPPAGEAVVGAGRVEGACDVVPVPVRPAIRRGPGPVVPHNALLPHRMGRAHQGADSRDRIPVGHDPQDARSPERNSHLGAVPPPRQAGRRRPGHR